IAVVERAALEDWDVHGLEVLAADDLLTPMRRGLSGSLRASDDRIGSAAHVAVERHVGRGGGRRDAGDRAGLLYQPCPEGAIRGGIRVARRGQRDLRGQDVLRREAGIDALELREALEQET